MSTKPATKPQNPNFSSGPCAKIPGFELSMLKDAPLGRSHRGTLGKGKLAEAIEKTKTVLEIPADYLVGIVPASDTGAMEMAMWNLLGERGVDVVWCESFGKGWANDISNQLRLKDINVYSAGYGELPDLSKIDFSRDVVFAWNGTTSGVKVPNGDFIPADRQGLTICDATSAVFAMDIDWSKLDVATFSWQKVLGGEAAHGMLVLSPRAVERINTYSPPWPIPKILLLKSNGKIMLDIFEGSTINTPSMLCNEDYLVALEWATSVGGLKKLQQISDDNLKAVERFVDTHDWIHFLAADKSIRSNTSVCLSVDLSEDQVKKLVKLLEAEGASYDVASYRDAPVGLRYWCGSTVQTKDVEIAMEWLEWAYNEVV
ncbi:MAG: phosphoserine transaminase [Peptococcaceae bacterium]|jgi:phosphoserine aminotransferase|nr:phosphoserine transaminase [Peptococcaceae bacterium]